MACLKTTLYLSWKLVRKWLSILSWNTCWVRNKGSGGPVRYCGLYGKKSIQAKLRQTWFLCVVQSVSLVEPRTPGTCRAINLDNYSGVSKGMFHLGGLPTIASQFIYYSSWPIRISIWFTSFWRFVFPQCPLLNNRSAPHCVHYLYVYRLLSSKGLYNTPFPPMLEPILLCCLSRANLLFWQV